MGMAIITLCALIGSPTGTASALLFTSIWSWETSCAHFNPAVTFGSIIMSSIEKG